MVRFHWYHIDHDGSFDDNWMPVYDNTKPLDYSKHVYRYDISSSLNFIYIYVYVQSDSGNDKHDNLLRYGILKEDLIFIIPFNRNMVLIRLKVRDIDFSIGSTKVTSENPLTLTYTNGELYVSIENSLSAIVDDVLLFDKKLHGSLEFISYLIESKSLIIKRIV